MRAGDERFGRKDRTARGTSGLTTTIKLRNQKGEVIGEQEVATYKGLLSMAHEDGLKRVSTKLLQVPDEANGMTAIASAEVETIKGVFHGLGDANPGNVNARIRPHLIRMAETRAKARALRDAVNIGMVALEELGDLDQETSLAEREPLAQPSGNTQRQPVPVQAGDQDKPADLMTEAQARYLFRLLASQGINGTMAHERLQAMLRVANLKDVSRQAASDLIEKLKAENEARKGGGQ